MLIKIFLSFLRGFEVFGGCGCLFFKFYLFVYVYECTACMQVCTLVLQCLRGQKRASDSPGTGVLLELELQTVLSRHVGAGD